MLFGISSTMAQENSGSKFIRTESNGVNYYQAYGVEGNEVVTPQVNAQRTINDLNVEECKEAVISIDSKINHLKEQGAKEVDLKPYYLQREKFVERINSLNNK